MDAVKELDSLIEMMRDLLEMPGNPGYKTPEYRKFHEKLTHFIFRNHLDETEEWNVIHQNLIYKSTQYMVTKEADTILLCLESLKCVLLKKAYEPFWQYIHPNIYSVAKDRFAGELYADSIEAAFKEINSRVKLLVKKYRSVESDGADLMRKCFSENNPVLTITDMDTESGRNVQKGYMEMFAGAMIGIRNPKAHANQRITREDAVRKLHFASLLMYKVDQAIYNTGIIE